MSDGTGQEKGSRMAKEFKVLIADLYPYETGVVAAAVQSYRRKIACNKPFVPPMVVRVDGEWLVVDGTNTVAAAKAERLEEISVTERIVLSDHDLMPYRTALEQAMAANRRGFNSISVYTDAQERSDQTETEMSGINMTEVARRLGIEAG